MKIYAQIELNIKYTRRCAACKVVFRTDPAAIRMRELLFSLACAYAS